MNLRGGESRNKDVSDPETEYYVLEVLTLPEKLLTIFLFDHINCESAYGGEG